MELVKLQSLQEDLYTDMQLGIEAVCHNGNQALHCTGLIDSQLKDALDKIRSLLYRYCPWGPLDRIVVNFTPADKLKTGSHLELPLFVAIACLLVFRAKGKEGKEARSIEWPELQWGGSLDLKGELSHTPLTQQWLSEGKNFLGAHTFNTVEEIVSLLERSSTPEEAMSILKSHLSLSKAPSRTPKAHRPRIDVHGRHEERCALIAASISQDPVILLGPPGVGKSYLASWLSSILPLPSPEEQKLISRAWRKAGLQYELSQVPCFAPHSKSHLADFIGRKNKGSYRPGYLNLCHRGVLILDEFSELSRDTRELFRNTLETKKLTVFHSQGSDQLPADFMLIATANPCLCGFTRPDSRNECRCSLSQWRNYQQRFSGPLMDRFAIHFFLDEIPTSHESNESFIQMKEWAEASPEDLAQKIARLRLQFKKEMDKDSIQKVGRENRRSKLQKRIFKSLKLMGFTDRESTRLSSRWCEKVKFQV